MFSFDSLTNHVNFKSSQCTRSSRITRPKFLRRLFYFSAKRCSHQNRTLFLNRAKMLRQHQPKRQATHTEDRIVLNHIQITTSSGRSGSSARVQKTVEMFETRQMVRMVRRHTQTQTQAVAHERTMRSGVAHGHVKRLCACVCVRVHPHCGAW